MKVPSFDFPTEVNIEVQDAFDYLSLVLNNGKYQLKVVTTEPSWTANDGETVIYDASGTKWLYYYADSAWWKVQMTAA